MSVALALEAVQEPAEVGAHAHRERVAEAAALDAHLEDVRGEGVACLEVPRGLGERLRLQGRGERLLGRAEALEQLEVLVHEHRGPVALPICVDSIERPIHGISTRPHARMLPAHLSLASPAVLDAVLAHGVLELQRENAALREELRVKTAAARAKEEWLGKDLAYARETSRLLYSRFIFR